MSIKSISMALGVALILLVALGHKQSFAAGLPIFNRDIASSILSEVADDTPINSLTSILRDDREPGNVTGSEGDRLTDGKEDKTDVSEYIYQIKADCQASPHLRLQTGVRIQGHSGIITALHGVVGCAEIIATSQSLATANELQNVSDLEIVQVDIDRDIALLAPKEIKKRELWKVTEGVVPLTILPLVDCPPISPIDVFLWGYPEPYTEIISRPGLVVCRTLLRKRIPAQHAQRQSLSARNSPQLSINILDVSVFATHGYSGGPLLVRDKTLTSDDDRVIGIVIGGLAINVANAWAVPWPEVELIPVEQVRVALTTLAAQNLSDTLMVYLGSDIPPPTGQNNIVIRDSVSNQIDTIRVDLVETYEHDMWLAVFTEGSDPYDAEYIAKALISAPWSDSVKLYFRNATVKRNIEKRLETDGAVELEAYLFINNTPINKFNRIESGRPWDEPVILVSGQMSQRFLLKKDNVVMEAPSE